jgi:hypothetical protein
MIPEVMKIEFSIDRYLCNAFVVHKEKEKRDNLFSSCLIRKVKETE